MALVIKLDEDLSPMIGVPLHDAGYDVRTVVAQGWGGLDDRDIWERVKKERAFFIDLPNRGEECGLVV